MANDAGLEIQKAVRFALVADVTLQGLMGGAVAFYDHVPERTAWPYLEYRPVQQAQWDVVAYPESDGYGEEHVFSIHCWSDYEGVAQLSNILRRVQEVLRDTLPSVTDHNVVNLRHQFRDVVKEPDGQTYHGIAQFRAVTEEA